VVFPNSTTIQLTRIVEDVVVASEGQLGRVDVVRTLKLRAVGSQLIASRALLPASPGGLTPPPSGLSDLRSDARTSSFSASPS
jgi:hypothetical protein